MAKEETAAKKTICRAIMIGVSQTFHTIPSKLKTVQPHSFITINPFATEKAEAFRKFAVVIKHSAFCLVQGKKRTNFWA